MVFCSSCGEPVNGRFCEKCGTPVEAPAPAAAPVAFTPPPPPPPPPPVGFAQPKATMEVPLPAGPAGGKKKGPLFWILGGCGVLVLLGGITFVGTGLFVAKKVSDAGMSTDLLKKNPALAAAKLMVAANPDVEVVSMDEDKGVITIRDKKSGKTITMNAEDIKNGKLSFEDESTGEKMTLGADKDAKLPEWVPSYPGSKPEGSISATGGDSEGGMAHFKTPDAGPKVLAFYTDELKKAGYKITATMSGTPGDGSGGMVAGENAATKKSVMVTLSTSSEGTDVAVTYGSKK